jgi:(2Fe-2S) ferredoxin
MSYDPDFVKAKIKKNKIGSYRRHIFLCTGPSCCAPEESQIVWERLKAVLKEKDPDQTVYRSKANCLRICNSGPVALVYPEGIWYRNVDLKAIDEIIDQHLLAGSPVEELIIAENPLTDADS